MRTARIAGALLLAVTLGAGPAMAAGETCTEELIEAKQGELMAYLEANPEKGQRLEEQAAEVEKDYGGEPPQDKVCEALDKLMDRLKAL